MGPVATLVAIFITLSLLIKLTWEKIELFLKSNFKYKFLNALGDYIYYGYDMGVDGVLKLDGAADDVVAKRMEGQKYLREKLEPTIKEEQCKGKALAASLVDCRFALAKVCMPLLRELEFSNAGRNFITGVYNKNVGPVNGAIGEANGTYNGSASGTSNGKANGTPDAVDTAAGILTVLTEDGIPRPYVGNDAVHTLGVKAFYEPIQREVDRRMSMTTEKGETSNDVMMKFCPIAMNSALETNVGLLKQLTGMDKVRYALSGSEAVDATLKDIITTTSKPLVIRFQSAYHGHLSGISFLSSPNHVYLPELSQGSLDFIEKYHYRIAAVIVNPMQFFTGVNKASPPGEKVTHTKRVRGSEWGGNCTPTKEEYAKWLHSLQEKCNYCTKYLTKVALVMDDIYFAFRTPELLSAKYFVHPETKEELKPDVIVLGKALAGGYPLSAVVGRDGFLNAYDKKFLLKVNKTVGTMAAWYGGVVASNVFLEAVNCMGKGSAGDCGCGILEVGAKEQLECLVKKCDDFTKSLNAKFEKVNVPVRIRNFSNTFSIDYLSKSLYNSRYPQYLLAENIFLGNYSTGKFNLNGDVTSQDFAALEEKFVAAANKMQEHGYFVPISTTAKVKFYLTLLARFTKNYLKIYYDQIMQDKHIDIQVSHNHPVNKFGHFWSSVGMILFAYPYLFWWGECWKGCAWFFGTHVVRQSGHFFYEHQDRDIEKLKFGHKDASKKEAVAFLTTAFLGYKYRAALYTYVTQIIPPSFIDPYLELSLDQYVLTIALFTVVPHFVEIVYQYGVLRGVSWALKILTDPFTDLLDFYTHMIIDPKWFLDLKDQRATYRLDIKTKKVTKVE